MNENTMYKYEDIFGCVISLREPDGIPMLLVRETRKLYDIERYTVAKLNDLMEKSIKDGKNRLLESCIDREIVPGAGYYPDRLY